MRNAKKSIFAFIFIFIGVLTINAQSNIRYGLKGGVNMSRIKNLSPGTQTRTGISFGGFAQIPLTTLNYGSTIDDLVFQPEIMFSHYGEKNEYQGKDEKIFLNYIILPLMVKYFFLEVGDENYFYGEIGPQLGFKVSDNVTLESPDYNPVDVKGFDLQGVLGVGYTISDHVDINFRFKYGFSDVIDSPYYYEGTTEKNYNVQFFLGLGYTF